jgi:metal iron transporter
MAELKVEEMSPVTSETPTESKAPNVHTASAYDKPKRTWWDIAKNSLLAKAPLEGAPLEYGGHRVAEEPERKLGFGGLLSKFARFFGPGMILVVAYIDPDNFQTSISDGQDFGYKMLFMVFFSLVLAIYLQVGGLFCTTISN